MPDLEFRRLRSRHRGSTSIAPAADRGRGPHRGAPDRSLVAHELRRRRGAHLRGGAAALSTVSYDAAILDLGLPDGDGIALLSATRASGNKIPIIILTARDAVEDRVCGLDSGADDYLVKPFATVELVARIKALLDRKS